MACENIESEFTLYKLSLAHENKEDFIVGLWSWCQSKCFTSYRLSVSILLTFYLIFDIVWETLFSFSHNPGYWFLYAMNWSFLLLVISYLILTVISTRYSFKDVIPTANQIYWFWIFYIVASSTIGMSTLVYWMSLYSSTNELFRTIPEICKHSILISFLIFDLSLSAIPVRLFHALYAIVIAVCYLLFIIFYTLLNGPTPSPSRVIYPNLTSQTAANFAMIIFSVLFIAILVYTLLYTVYVTRMFVKDITADSSGSQPSSQMNEMTRSSSSASNSSVRQTNRGEKSPLPKNFKSYSAIEE